MSTEHGWNDTDGKTGVFRGKPVPFSTTNLAWSGLGLDLGLHSDRLVTNCLRHGTALPIRQISVPSTLGTLQPMVKLFLCTRVEKSDSCTGHFIPGERAQGIH